MDEVPQSLSIETTKKSTRVLVLSVIICLMLIILLGTSAYTVLEHKRAERARALAALSSSTAQNLVHPESFTNLSLEASAAYVLDLSTDTVLYEKNARTQLPLASLTKLMTALVAVNLIPTDTPVVLESQVFTEEGDVGLVVGQKWDRTTLSNLTLVASSNGGARALSLAGEKESGKNFLNEMNVRSRNLGMTETFYGNPTGLDLTGTQGGSYGSAHDMALLMGYVVKSYPELIQATRFPLYTARSKEGALTLVRNTNQNVSNIPGIIGSKTGFTDLARGNLVIAFDRGLAQPVVIAVLGSSQEGRFRDVESLVLRTFAYYNEPLTAP